MLLSVCVRELAQRETFCNTKPTCQHSTLHTQSISIELMRRYRKKKKKKRLGKLFTYAGKKKLPSFAFGNDKKKVGKSKQIQSSKAVLYCNEILNDSGRRGSYLKTDVRETNERRFVGDAWRLKNVLAHVWKKKKKT